MISLSYARKAIRDGEIGFRSHTSSMRGEFGCFFRGRGLEEELRAKRPDQAPIA